MSVFILEIKAKLQLCLQQQLRRKCCIRFKPIDKRLLHVNILNVIYQDILCMLFPKKSFIMAINTSRDALDLQNVAPIPKVSFTVGQSHSVTHLKG